MDLMNKQGQTGIFFLFMIFVVVFILGFALASPLITNSNAVRSTLNCSNSSIDTSQKVTCTTIDITAPWIIGVIFGLGGLALGAKLLGQ